MDAELLSTVRNGSWLDEQTFPPLRFAVPGLIPEGFVLFIGPPKAGKSLLNLGLLLAVAAGGRALSKIPVGDPRRVLYFALEDGDRRMQDRCRMLLGTGVPIPERFHYQTDIRPGKLVPTVEAFLRSYPDTALVVLDTLGKVMPPAMPGESAYARDYRIGGALKRIADDCPGLAMVALHHDRKASAEDFVDSVSGTHGLAGAADTIIVLSRKRQATDGLLKITGRDVLEAEFALTMPGGAWELDGEHLAEAAERAAAREETEHLGDLSTEILAFVRSAGSEGASTKEVEDKFGENARRYLARLTDAERLIRVKRGRYSVPTQTPVPSVPTSQTEGAKVLQLGHRDSWDTP